MVTTARLNIRCSQNQKKILKDYCSKRFTKMSDLILISVFEYIKSNPVLEKEIKDLAEAEKRNIYIRLTRERNKTVLHDVYFVKNWNRRLLDVARHSLFNNDGHHFDVGVIESCLKMMKEEYKLLKPSIKRNIDIKQFDNWKSEVYIRQKLGILKSLPIEEARRITGK